MVVVEEGGGGVAMRQQEEPAAQKEELGQPAVGEGDQQDLVEVVDTDDPKDKEATETLPATQPEGGDPATRKRGHQDMHTHAIQATRTHGLPSDESHAQRLP